MFCEHCGTKLDDDSVFCFNCGARLDYDVENQDAEEEMLKVSNDLSVNEKNEAIEENPVDNVDEDEVLEMDGVLGDLKQNFNEMKSDTKEMFREMKSDAIDMIGKNNIKKIKNKTKELRNKLKDF